MNKMKTIYIAFLLIGYSTFAQSYIEGGKTRHRFAQLNFGVDQRYFFGAGSKSALINSSGHMEYFHLNNQTESRLIIGGTHFWGHADFYIAIPTLSFGKSGFHTGVETGAKYFPWQIRHAKLRPYLGVTWLPVFFQQGEGTVLMHSRYPFIAGAVYNFKNHLIELGAGYIYDNKIDYYIGTNSPAQIKTQSFWVSIGYKFMIETTLNAEKDWQSGRTRNITDTLAKLKRLNGFTISVGPSSAFFLRPSPHNEAVAPYADNHKFARIFAEFGIGYYFHKPDLQLNIAYRGINSSVKAYDFSQEIKRNALTIEGYKFFADYYGFAPFVGLSVSYERLNVRENKQQNIITGSYTGFKPGLIFGWDIRPNRIQSWYLRTNIRYCPNLHVTMPGNQKVHFDQLEFNFIQLVVFPGRIF